MIVHRLSEAQHHTVMLEDMGIGASLVGGRWNSAAPAADRHMIHTSSSLSLAMLEVLVHTGGKALRAVPYVRSMLEVDEDAAEHLDIALAVTGGSSRPRRRVR